MQEEIFGSAYASAVYISSVLKLPKDKKVYVIGEAGLEEELAEEGISYLGGTVRIPPYTFKQTVANSAARIPRITNLGSSLSRHIRQIPPSLLFSVVWTHRSITQSSPRPSTTFTPTLPAISW
jgi:hypothetical protein